MSLSLTDFAQLVQTTLRSLQMYTANHPRTRDSSQMMLNKLNEHFQESGTIKITASNGRLFMDAQPGDARNMHCINLCRALTDRSISGFQIDRGVELDELISMMEVLLLKPQRLDEMGGAEAVLTNKNMPHVRLTQTKYMELDDDMEESTSSGEQDEELERRRLFNLWLTKFKECIGSALKESESTFWQPLFNGELPPANLKEMGRLAIDLKWETNPPPTIHWEAVQLALENLTSAEQLSIVTGRASLPDIPPSLNKVIDGFVPDILGKAAVKLDTEGADWKGLKEAIYLAIVAKGDVSEFYKTFGTHWIKSGKEANQVSEIKNRLQWDYLPLKEQLSFIDKPGGLWSLAESQRKWLISQILEKNIPDTFHSLLEKITYASGHGDASFRENAARTLEIIASSIEAHSIPKEDEAVLLKTLIENFIRETEPHVMAVNVRCIQFTITNYINNNDLQRATALLAELDKCNASESPTSDERTQLLANLKSHLCVRSNVKPIIQQYFEHGSEYFNSTALPWLRALGSKTVEILMEMLAEESDRRRRGQIMDAIRAFGSDILPELIKSLESDRWFLVRNTLILIAEMADNSCYSGVVKCLQHSDTRVKRAAARTLWRGFGKQAVVPFLRVFKQVEPEIFEEILFGLAQVPAPEAVPVALEYAVDTNNPDRLRAMALNVLAHNPVPETLPVLTEFVKRKGRIITTAEPIEIRTAAARAMVAIGQEGKDKLLEIIKAEPSGTDRDELNRILGA